MTTHDKCRAMSIINDVGKEFFENDNLPKGEQVGALRAIRMISDLLMLEPEDDPLTDPLTGERRRP